MLRYLIIYFSSGITVRIILNFALNLSKIGANNFFLCNQRELLSEFDLRSLLKLHNMELIET